MTRDALERHQVWAYLVAVSVGVLVGTRVPDIGDVFAAALWPVLGVLLYVTFVQVPIASIAVAMTNVRFLSAALLGNFVAVPLAVWGLVHALPVDGALRAGLLMVLLVPCTDWFITFSRLGGGDVASATAVTPLNLMLQLVLLPLYLWLFSGAEFSAMSIDIWPALIVVLVPFAAAVASELWGRRRPARRRLRERVAWAPVPLLSLVMFLVAAANVGAVSEALGALPVVAAAAVSFLMMTAILAKVLSRVFQLPLTQGRTLAFSFGTRNSFVVLPVALALPAGWEIAAVVVVMQSLIELLAMIFYIWFVPRVLFPEQGT